MIEKLRLTRAMILGIFCLSILSGCADGLEDKKHKQRVAELEDRAHLRSTLRPLVGTYVGDVSNEAMGKDPFPVQLIVFIGEEPDGVNENGELKLRPELRALYRRLDYRYDSSSEKNLIGRFYVETSSLTFVSQTNMSRENESVTFAGVYRDGEIAGELSNYRGVMGLMKVKRLK
jgi:hypothetical protein